MSFKILFVCTGNTCRSPMAEGTLRHWLDEHQKTQFLVSSAGIAAQPGLPPSPLAVEAMREKKIDISGHRSRLAGDAIIREADLILAMSALQKQVLEDQYFEAAEKKIHLLSHYADRTHPPIDIPDPLGRDKSAYRAVRDLIEGFIRKIAEKM